MSNFRWIDAPAKSILVTFIISGWANIGALGGLINASIHTIMYIYFLLATFPTMRRHLWWKKHLTLLQMAQFIAMISQFVIVYSQHDHCGYPKGVLINGRYIDFSSIAACRRWRQQSNKARRTNMEAVQGLPYWYAKNTKKRPDDLIIWDVKAFQPRVEYIKHMALLYRKWQIMSFVDHKI